MVVVNPNIRTAGKGCAWMMIVSASLFVGLMIASAGIAIYPRTAAPGAALVCSGEVVYESFGASYRPGEYTVTRQIYCVTGAGKDAAREEITFQAAGVSFLIYSALAFVLLAGLGLLLRRKARDLLAAPPGTGVAVRSADADAGAAYSPADISSILEQVAEAVQRGGPNVSVRSMRYDAGSGRMVEGDDGADDEAGLAPAERLTRLKQLYDQGLITAAEYQAKRAEILSGL